MRRNWNAPARRWRHGQHAPAVARADLYLEGRRVGRVTERCPYLLATSCDRIVAVRRGCVRGPLYIRVQPQAWGGYMVSIYRVGRRTKP